MGESERDTTSTPTKRKLGLTQFIYHPRTPVRTPNSQSTAGTSAFRPFTPDSPTKKKQKKKPNLPFAPPETYEHLRPLNDCLGENMKVLFCGINPGVTSAKTGAHFAHPTNHFWPCLHASGFTDERMSPEHSFLLPDKYHIGITNLTDRPSTEAGELSRREQHDNASVLLQRIVKYRPRIVCFLGLGIWSIFLNHLMDIIALPQSGIFDDDEEDDEEDDVPPEPPKKKRKRNLHAQAVATTSKYFSPPSSPADVSEERRLRRRFKRKAGSCKDLLGLKPIKIVYPPRDAVVQETIFYSLPSSSARVVTWQLGDKIELFKEFKATVDLLEEGKVRTERCYVIESSSL